MSYGLQPVPIIVWRRLQLCINYTAKPPADSNCRGDVSCNEVLNNEGSVLNLEEKLGLVYPKNVVCLFGFCIVNKAEETDTNTYSVIFLHYFTIFC